MRLSALRDKRGAYSARATFIARTVSVLAGLGVICAITNSYQQSVIATFLIYGIAAMGLTVLMGWIGRPSVMTAGNLLAGEYCTVFLVNVLGWPFLIVLIVCTIAGGLFGAIAAVPARRLSGIYLLLSTLAVFYVVTDLGNIVQSAQGALGGYFLPSPALLGYDLSSGTHWVWVSGILGFLTYEYFRYLRGTRFGRAWIAARDNEDAASVSGVRISYYVTTAFALSTAVQFLAGSLLAYLLGSVSYNSVSLLLSVNFIVMIVLGGMGSLPGAVAGAAVVTAVPAFMNSSFGAAGSSDWWTRNLVPVESIVFALIGIFVLLGMPKNPVKSVLAAIARRKMPHAPTISIGDNALVALKDVTAQYGAGESAVSNATLSLDAGQAMALLGRNGAGKSSTLYAIAGFPPGTSGRVTAGCVQWRDESGRVIDISHARIYERTRLGIVLVPAEDKVFVNLSVRDHLREASAGNRFGRARDGDLANILGKFPALAEKLDRPAGNLSGGERQQLALAIAMARNARLMLIDEASLGLAPIAVMAIETLLLDIKRNAGRGLIIAEQNPHLAMSVADAIALLDAGAVIRLEKPSEDLLRTVERNYLGLVS